MSVHCKKAQYDNVTFLKPKYFLPVAAPFLTSSALDPHALTQQNGQLIISCLLDHKTLHAGMGLWCYEPKLQESGNDMDFW